MAPDAIDADHSNIAKPKDQHSTQYLAVKAAFMATAPSTRKLPLNDSRVTGKAPVGSSNRALAAELNKLHHSSFEKEDRFTTAIPFIFSDYLTEIPVDGNSKDPLSRTYSTLNGIATFHTDASPGGPRLDWNKMPSADAQVFVTRVLQCYILRSIFELQDPPTTWSFNDADGLTTDAPVPVYVPDKEAYPKDEWVDQIESLGLDYWKPNDRFLPLLTVPEGAIVSFATKEAVGNSPDHYIVRIDRRPEFSVSFALTPAMSGNRTLPKSFTLLPYRYRGDIETYTFNFVVDFDFTWDGDRDKGERYQEWALGLAHGMKKRLATPTAEQP